MPAHRVIQWFTGDIAQHQIRLVHDHPDLELVGALVWHDDKDGADAGEIAGIGPIGVRATTDVDAVLALDADVILHNPPTETYADVPAMLASGKNVISIMGGWYPKAYDEWPAIEDACRAGGASLYGTGLNPGISYELAILGSSLCHEVESVRISTCERQSTLSPVFLEKFGFGRTEEELAGDRGASAIFENLLQITDLICDEIGLPRDGHSFTHTYEPATKDYDEKILVREGTMAGLIVEVSATHRGEPKATIELRFLLGTEWVSEEFLAGAPDFGWIEVDVRGTPGNRFQHEIYADEKIVKTRSTGTRAVNAIPSVIAAPPGLVTAADLPLQRTLFR